MVTGGHRIRMTAGATLKRWLTDARAAFAAVVLCCAAPVAAGEFDYRFSVGGGFSDNPGHLATNEEDTSFATASTDWPPLRISDRQRGGDDRSVKPDVRWISEPYTRPCQASVARELVYVDAERNTPLGFLEYHYVWKRLKCRNVVHLTLCARLIAIYLEIP